ncbi:MAG: universal stress protein [Rhodocyclaceae bacterium]|nr:universal stress protein [Rhodocyclaceae bacterium]MCP5297944.1 universal stress protein [Zoogloeaceae bacterium]MCW5596901.1 universal stress protein [Rhodocyclaceae bacterium]
MLKMLVPVDGSEYGVRAVAYMAKLHDEDARIEVHLLNVQIPIESGHVRLFVEHDELQDYYREEGIAALAAARNALDQAGVPYRVHVAVGHIADTILLYASELNFDIIVMGTHGRSKLMQIILGSVANDVVKRSSIPVTLIK